MVQRVLLAHRDKLDRKAVVPLAQVVPQGLKVLLDSQALVVLGHKGHKDHKA